MKNNDNQTGGRKGSICAESISRRDALKKAGKYAALTSATMMLILSPRANAQVSQPGPVEQWPNNESSTDSDSEETTSHWWLP